STSPRATAGRARRCRPTTRSWPPTTAGTPSPAASPSSPPAARRSPPPTPPPAPSPAPPPPPSTRPAPPTSRRTPRPPPARGAQRSITVTALDQFNNTATGYLGTVHFTKSDPGTGSAVPADYTFVAGDNGVHTFTNGVTFVTAGSQSITATDTVTSSITGTSN